MKKEESNIPGYLTPRDRKQNFQPASLVFSDQLHRIRRRSGLRQKDVASGTGASPGAISLWERGKRVPREKSTIELLAAVLGATESEKTELLRAAGFGDIPPQFKIEVLNRCQEFLEDSTVDEGRKNAFLGILKNALSIVRS